MSRPLGLALLLLVGCQEPANPPTVTSGRPSAAARWVAARSAERATLFEAPAEVLAAPGSLAAVALPFPGRVVRIAVQIGERVERGQVVVEALMPQVVAAAGAYVAARSRGEAFAKRRQQLEALRVEGLARLADLAEVETRLAEARADGEIARATLRAAGVDGPQAAAILDGGGVIALRSPIAGLVSELDVRLGEQRDPAAAPVARLVGSGAPRVAARLVPGVVLDEPTGYELILGGAASRHGARCSLRLLTRSPVVDPRDGMQGAWFEPMCSPPPIAGLTGRLRVVPGAADLVAVPVGAVGLGAEGPFVVARTPDGERRIAVVVLAASGAEALIRGALTVGSEVRAEAPSAGGAEAGGGLDGGGR